MEKQNEILENGLEAVIDRNSRNCDNLIFMLCVMSIVSLSLTMMMYQQCKVIQVLNNQIEQRDSVIAADKAMIKELETINLNLSK